MEILSRARLNRSSPVSREEEELVAVEERAAERGQAVLARDGFGFEEFLSTRLAAEGELVGACDLGRERIARIFLNAGGEGGGLVEGEAAVEEVQRLNRSGRFAPARGALPGVRAGLLVGLCSGLRGLLTPLTYCLGQRAGNLLTQLGAKEVEELHREGAGHRDLDRVGHSGRVLFGVLSFAHRGNHLTRRPQIQFFRASGGSRTQFLAPYSGKLIP